MSNSFPVTESTTQDINNFAANATKNKAPESAANIGGYLKFSGKTGRWEMGKDEEDFSGVEVFINMMEAQHGFLRWGTKPPAKAYSKITSPLPEAPAPFDGVDEKGRPKTHMAQEARILIGATFDEHAEPFILELGSMGGVDNVKGLIDAALVKAVGSLYFFPVVRLGVEHYTRDTGKVYKPVFEIISWRNIDGDEEGAAPKKIAAAAVVEDEPEFEEEPEEEAPAPKKRRRKAAE